MPQKVLVVTRVEIVSGVPENKNEQGIKTQLGERLNPIVIDSSFSAFPHYEIGQVIITRI